MNSEDINRMWLQSQDDAEGMRLGFTTQQHYFAALVAAAERKRLHDKFMEIHKSQQHSNNYWHFAARKIMEEPDVA